MHPLTRYLDPRSSLASAIGWLVFALSIGLVLVASVWVGDIVRTNLLDQRDRQLDRAADRIVCGTESRYCASTAIGTGVGGDAGHRARRRRTGHAPKYSREPATRFPRIRMDRCGEPARPGSRRHPRRDGGRKRCRPIVVRVGFQGGESRRCPTGANANAEPACANRRCASGHRIPDRVRNRCQGKSRRCHWSATEHALAVGSGGGAWAEAARVSRYRSAGAGREWHGIDRTGKPQRPALGEHP